MKGLMPYKDKAKQRETRRLYYISHEKEIKEKNKKYREAHRAEKKESMDRWVSNNRDKCNRKSKAWKWKKAGIKLSYEAYLDISKNQNGLCAICRKVPDRQGLRVDHDHETGKIRGLLCNKCNLGLGLLGDTVSSVEAVLRYVYGR